MYLLNMQLCFKMQWGRRCVNLILMVVGKESETWTSCVVILQWNHPLCFNTCVFSFKSYQEEDRHLRLTGRLQKTAEDEQYYCRKHDAWPNWRVFFSTLLRSKWAVLLPLSRLTSSSLDALYIELQCPPLFTWLSEIATAEHLPNRISSLLSSTHLNVI